MKSLRRGDKVPRKSNPPSGVEKRVDFLKIGIYVFLILVSMPIFLGFLWLFIGSVSKNLTYGIVPQGFSLKNWRFLWKIPYPGYPDIWLTFLNTLFLAFGVMIIVVVVSTMAGYVISRMKFPGRSLLLASTLILHAFPAITLLIGLYYVLRVLHLLDSVIGVILAKAGLFIPFAIWVMKGFFDGISWDVEMSALIDGASRFQVFRKIVLPMVGPGIAGISIFAFITGWSEFIFVITFIRKPSAWTFTSYVNSVISDYRFADFGLLAATSLFYVMPVLLFFIFTQKYLMRITVGGMKGGR